MNPTNNTVPRHIGIILDGNRRFAKRLMIKPWKGHEWGVKKLEKLLNWCRELDIKELTLYAFSIDNFNRPKEEFDYLMDVFRDSFDRLKNDPRIDKYKIRINIIGRINLFPKDLQKKMYYIMNKTKNYKNYIINFAMAYGGRAEIIDAVKKIAEQIKKGKLNIKNINEKLFAKNLYLNSEPDLIIRTGGEKRTSDFLNFQSGYSEWIFLDKLWPEFDKKDFISCIYQYKLRARRFGI